MEYVIQVQGMSCGHCVRSITQAVQKLAPEAVVDVDLATATVVVKAQLSAEQVLEAIEAQGFDATLA